MGVGKAFGGSGFVGFCVGVLVLDPVPEGRVGQFLEGGVVEAVVVDHGGEAVLASVPDVPEERALVEERAVLLEEFVAQPVFEGFRF